MQASTSEPSAAADPAAATLAEQLLTLWRNVITHGGVGVYTALEELDLTLTQIKALTALASDELTVKQVAERLGLSLPGTSRAVDGLVERGLVHRREDDEDRRMKRLLATDAGRAALHRLDDARLAGLERFTATLAPADCRRLSSALRPIIEGISTKEDA